jgi:DedD protein
MDSRAKQRLTGAVILVALFVLLVPELLTGPKNAPAPATAEEEGLRRYTIDLNAPAGGTGQLPESAVTLPPVAAQPDGPEGERAQPGEAAAPAVSATEAAQAPPPETPAATPPASQPARQPAAATTSAPAARPAQPQPAAQTAPRADSRNVTPPSGSFVVQLGSFGSRDNAERLVRDMTARGFATFIAPITTNGRELYRVRVGPTRDRASAEALAAQLKRMGQSGSIVPIP